MAASSERRGLALSIVKFHSRVNLDFSRRTDGIMAAGGGKPSTDEQLERVKSYLSRHGFNPDYRRVFVTYGDDHNYTDIDRVFSDTKLGDIYADALYTVEPGMTLTLPVADCLATVVYDPVTGMVGLLHLGRHASMANLIEAFVIDVADDLGSDPRDWYVWMSPSIRPPSDVLQYFELADTDEWRDFVSKKADGTFVIDTASHNQARFIRAGVDPGRIVIDSANTYEDPEYFSFRAATEKDDIEKRGHMMAAVSIKPAL